MPSATPIILGVTAVVIVLVIGWFVTRWGVFDDDTEDEGAERIDRDQQNQRELDRIPIRDKHRQLTLPMKVLIVAAFLVSGAIGFYTYQFFKTGNPTEFAYIRELQYMVVAVVGVGGGVLFKDHINGRLGKLEIDFESTDGTDIDQTSTVWFLWSETQARDDGTLKVKALFPSLILRLFPRKRLVGHDPRLRGDRPLGKRIKYEVPRSARELEDGFYIRTQGEKIVGGAASTDVDVRFKPPYELPYEAYVAQREQRKKMQLRLESAQAKRAEAEQQLQELKKLVKNNEYQERVEVLDEIERITDIVMPSQDQINLQQPGYNRQRQVPQSQQQHHAQNIDRNGRGQGGGRDA